MSRFSSLLLFLCCSVALAAQPSVFLKTEQKLLARERLLTELSQTLESWLTGRAGQEATLKTVRDLRAKLGTEAPLSSVATLEGRLAARVEAFVNQAEPTAEGQRELFRALSELSRDRSLALLEWRRAQLSKMKSRANWTAWELQWLPIWESEARLTHDLQLRLLAPESSDADANAALLQKVLGLRQQALSVKADSPELAKVQELSVGRLAILARAAEQLLRLNRSHSRGAVTRVRRLSKQLNDLTTEFQETRMKALQALVN